MTDGSTIKTTEYLDGFQYENQLLQFFPHSEGYVRVTTKSINPTNPEYNFNYAYNYTDHLGNIRLTYAKDPQTGSLKVMEENHYYPFGLKHQNYGTAMSLDFQQQLDEWGVIIAPTTNNPFKYKYNGKELQDELGLNMYDMDMRQYDPAIARWVVMDPVAHHSMSPYNAFDNNPVFWADPSGMNGESLYDMGGSSKWVNYMRSVERMRPEDGFASNGEPGDPPTGDPPTGSGLSEDDPVQLNEAVIVGKGRESNATVKSNSYVEIATKGSWGIGPLDWLTDKISTLYNNYEFYIDGDNHVLWGPQIALQGNIEGVGVGLAYGENMVEDNIGSTGAVGTIYRDEFSFTAGIFGLDYVDRRNGLGGPMVSSSRSGNLGPFSQTTTNGKTSYSIGAAFRAGLGWVGFKISGEVGIREK